MKTEITPEMMQALATLRASARGLAIANVEWAVNVLDNAGVFSAIDEATDYDPAPERVSNCTCPDTDYRKATGNHHANCPGDPAEWGDLARNAKLAAEWEAELQAERKSAKAMGDAFQKRQTR